MKTDKEKPKVNRLLINMLNKIEVINGAIDTCKRLKNNEIISLGGLIGDVKRGADVTDEFLDNRVKELLSEKSNLHEKVFRMRGY